MLVLHGFWSGAGVTVWAEDSEKPVTSRSQAMRAARPHPFAAASADLARLGSGTPGQAVLRLPSLGKSPLDSPEVVRLRPRGARSEPVLLPWQVPTITLSPAEALDWLTGVDGQEPEREPSDREMAAPEPVATPVAEARRGMAIRHLAQLATFAADLVASGRVLPALVVEAGATRARWRPVLQGPDVVAFGALVAALPPVCRAAPEHGEPHDVALATLRGFVDATMRARMAGRDLLPRRAGRRPRQVPAAEAFVVALTTPDGLVDADPADLSALARALSAWDEIGTGQVGPARATFRLGELGAYDQDAPGTSSHEPVTPQPGPTSWRLEFLLQSTLDPSLLVPAAQAWRDDGSLARWLDRPQELLLRELGRASRVYPELAAGLRQAKPEEAILDTDAAFHFLSVAAPALDQAGFGVLLPTWWDRTRRLGLRASASTPSDPAVTGGTFGRDALAQFRWSLAVGDETLTEDEIAALVEAKAPLVRLRGQWVAVDPEQLRRGLDFLRRQPAETRTVAEVLALARAHPDDLETPLPVTGITADGWLGDLLAGTAAATIAPVEPPESFAATLRPYQSRGLAWLSFLARLGFGACLADDMGLGKTVQLLALEAAERSEAPGRAPTLLVCPMSLVGNWEREAARFAPELRVYAHHGRDRLRGNDFRERATEADLVVTTYATGARDVEELAAYDWHRVVLDEAQAIKNSRSRTARAARQLPATQRVALTGTPVENRLSELWSIMEFLNPGLLGPAETFRARYAVPIERHGATDVAERLRAITRPYILRRLKTDPSIIDDLPEKIEITEYCRLTVEQASLYQSVVDDMMRKIETTEGIERRGNVLAAMAKLKQVCNHPAQVLHDRSVVGARSGKGIRLEELLEEILAEGDRVLCFTQYTEFAELLLPHLSAQFDTDIAYLHGGTPKARRDDLVARFQSDDGPPIFLLSLKAGGTGLNLTAANHVIHLDRWWNPAVENQATDRAFRIGQKRRVQVRKFVCTGTLEERIDEMIKQKSALADLVVGDGESWLTELSTGELRRLFALSEEAIGE